MPSEQLLWPATFSLPERPKVVYLDQKDFINLTKAAHGTKGVDPAYRELLAAVLRASQDGRACFPLSGTHYLETGAIRDARQRADVAEMMETVSDFKTMPSRVVVAEHEIEAALDGLLAEPPLSIVVPFLGTGAMWAFGSTGEFRVRGPDGTDHTAENRERVGPAIWDAAMRDASRDLDRKLLAGPTAEELPALRANGFAPEMAYEGFEKRLAFELDLIEIVKRADKTKWRADRLRDVVAVREMTHEWFDLFDRITRARGIASDASVISDQATLRQFSESMPANRVAITLKTRYHRDSNHRWTTNDIHDIDAFSIAAAYCDAVFSDKAVWNALSQARELRDFGTLFVRRPAELAEWLDRS